jgi:long-chain fatty acid transport protein
MKKRILLLAALGAAGSTAHGAGFGLIEQSASGLGASFAGSAANVNDASVQYFNPAGLALLDRPQVSVAVHALDVNLKFTNAGSTLPPAGLGQLPAGATGDDAGDLLWVPNLHVAWPIGERFVAGLSVSSPYGLKTEYQDPWIGRFQGLFTELKTININPSLGYRLNDKVALGVGISYQLADATLSNAVMLAAATEGRARLELDDAGWGWNLGLLFTPQDGTRVGVGYRSKVALNLAGDLTVTTLTGTVLAPAGGAATAAIDLPAQAYLSLAQALSPRFTLLADVSWTRWGVVQQLRAVNPATGGLRDVLNFGFEDKWRFALGGELALNEAWTLRAGAARDGSPVDDVHRTVRLPDDSRTWFTVGAQWRASERLHLDAGYAHLFVSDAPIALTRPQQNAPASFASTVRGAYSSSVDIVSLQLTYAFR